MIARAALAAALAGAVALAAAPTAHAARPLQLGFLDGVFTTPDGPQWLQRASDAGADLVRIDIGWPASTAPADARNPADPAYDFTAADAAIREASARGLRVLASFTGAPAWAEGPNRPDGASPGSWRPDPSSLEAYGAALARRYSGSFPDPPAAGAALPKVAAFQVWNEPNLSKYLAPQWSGPRTAAPAYYRRMLTAFYRGVKSASTAQVVTAGTAPFGDPQPGGDRIMPLRFWRDALCVRDDGGTLRGTGCDDPARFDVLAHHPYSVGRPTRGALNADDVSIPDLGRITRVLRAAERTGGALPRGAHPLWVTEVSYDSSPPDPDGVQLTQHAGYLELALYELWRQGVAAIVWFQVRDQAPEPSFAATNQSGVFFRDGAAKPALRAYRFPLVGVRARSSVHVWGRAPVAGRLRLQRRTASGWLTLRSRTVSAHATFATDVALAAGGRLRAQVGAETSLTFRVR